MRPGDLAAHPEGGRFREVFRSIVAVHRTDGAERAALTHIYFALEPGEASRFHRVAADEVWNLYRGAVRLHRWDATTGELVTTDLAAATGDFCEVVPAGCWQGAEPLDGPVLVGCTVAPGFEFSDFELMRPDTAEAQRLLALRPDLAPLVGG